MLIVRYILQSKCLEQEAPQASQIQLGYFPSGEACPIGPLTPDRQKAKE